MHDAQDALSQATELFRAGDYARAERLIERALAQNPQNAEALYLAGAIARQQGRLNFAIEVLREAIRLNPADPRFHSELGLTFGRQSEFEAALDCFRRAVKLQPDYADAVINAGTMLDRLGRTEEAKHWFERAVELNPNCPVARFNLANVSTATGNLREAKAELTRSVELQPNLAKAHWNKALCHLLLGEFAEGWDEYDWREPAGEVVIDAYPQPRWRGQPLAGKTILIHAEQGIGDEILFGSCLPDVIAQAQGTVVVCEPRLEPLFARSFRQATVIGYARRKDRAPAPVDGHVDYQAPLGDLPRYFRRSLDSFPKRDRFLVPNDSLLCEWRQRLQALGPGFKVGISWQAGGKSHERAKRAIPLAIWQPILTILGVQFINLQYGECQTEIAAVAGELGIKIHDWPDADPLIDLDHFAAKVAALDLVISVGNATVHIASALGVPAWALLPAVPNWRWLAAGERNPWYSSVRAMRQPTIGDWRPVLAEAARRLGALAKPTGASTLPPRHADKTLASTSHKQPPMSIDTIERPSGAPIDINMTLNQGIERFRAGDLAEAEARFNEVLAHAPRQITALHNLGRIALNTQRTDLAVRTFRRAAAVAPNEPMVLLDFAKSLHIAKQYDQAVENYRRVIQLDPKHSEAHFLIASALHDANRFEEAVAAFDAAERLTPDNPKIFNFRGNAHLKLKRFSDAERDFRRAVELSPGYTVAWNNLGCALRRQERQGEAEAALAHALGQDPNRFDVLSNLAKLHWHAKEYERGADYFERALRLQPQDVELLENYGRLLCDAGRYDESITVFDRVLEIQPNRYSTHGFRAMAEELQKTGPSKGELPSPKHELAVNPAVNPVRDVVYKPKSIHVPREVQERLLRAGQLFNEAKFEEAEQIAREILATVPEHAIAMRIVAVSVRRAGRHAEAIDLLKQAIDHDPLNFALYFELGVTYIETYQQKEACESFLRCRELRPQFQPVYVNLAGVMEQQERYEDALEWAKKAVELNPNCDMAHYNLANNYRECGRIEEAIHHYQESVRLKPDYSKADWNLGICHLHLGNYEEGWRRYENRVNAEEVKLDQYTQPRWNGQPIRDKTIVVHAEQGIGDEVVFCSCLPELLPLAGKIILVCDRRLEKLFQRSFPQVSVLGYQRRKDWTPYPHQEHIDCQIPMGSLPLYLRPTRSSFPDRPSFLVPDAQLVEQWRERFAAIGPGLKIGVSWRAGGKPLERRKRSTPLELWESIFRTPGVNFINLQYGDSLDDAAEVREQFGVELHDWEQGDPLVDVDNFAAKIAALDLVISVGNATVHLAGGLGTPAWTLLPMVPSWRWMVSGDRSPWYSSVRVFRQPRRTDWVPVFDRLGRMLGELVQSKPHEYRRRAMEVDAPLALRKDAPPVIKPLSEHEWLDFSQFSITASLEKIPEVLKQAEECYDRGEYDQAEKLYRSILVTAPRFPSALQGLSRTALRLGKTELAIRSIRRALSIVENVPVRRCDLALALAAAGRYDEAIQSFVRAIEIDPKLYRAHFEYGQLLARLGRHDEAAARFETAAALEPEKVEPIIEKARSLAALCRPEDAIEVLHDVIRNQPQSVEAYLALAELYSEDQCFTEAEAMLRQALARQPQAVAIHLKLAALLEQTKRDDEAAACYRKVLEIEPGNYAALVALGSLEGNLGRPADAERSFRRAIELQQPTPRELVNSLGLMLADQGRLDEALSCYDEALRIRRDAAYPLAHVHRAFALLHLGRYAEGWLEYEWRWQCPDAGRPRTHLRPPAWDGSSLANKTILIHGEQGVGDELMFATSYPDILRQAKKSIIVCEPRLECLFRRSFPGATIISVVRGLEHNWQIPAQLGVDVQIAAGSLPLHLRTSEAAFPRQQQLLMADASLVARWRERFAPLGDKLKVGISWRAGEKPKDIRLRTTTLLQWASLLQTPGVEFINLQHGDCRAELADVEKSLGVQIHHWADADNRNDLDGLAARMAALDLVISVGNANIHLAGALGVPAWSLLPCHGGWRWLAGRSDTPWYASVRLFRQHKPGDWEELFLRVGQELMNWQKPTADSKRIGGIPGPHWSSLPSTRRAG